MLAVLLHRGPALASPLLPLSTASLLGGLFVLAWVG